MAKNCHIGIIRPNGRVRSIYCHNDGGTKKLAHVLTTAYDTPEKVEALLKLGNISSLGEKLAPGPGTHTLDTPQPGVTVAYIRDDGRDRNQEKAYTDRNVGAAMRIYNDTHIYLFDTSFNGWLMAEPYGELKHLQNPTSSESDQKG